VQAEAFAESFKPGMDVPCWVSVGPPLAVKLENGLPKLGSAYVRIAVELFFGTVAAMGAIGPPGAEFSGYTNACGGCSRFVAL